MHPGDHSIGELWDQIKRRLGPGGLIRDTFAIDAQGEPTGLGSGWPEVCSAVFLRTPDDCRADAIGILSPCFSAVPATRSHQRQKRFTHCRRSAYRFRPREPTRKILLERDEYEPRAQLRNSVGTREKELPIRGVPEAIEFVENLVSVVRKLGRRKSAYILKHYGSGSCFAYEPQSFGEKVPLVIGTKLFTCDAEWRAGYSSGKQIYTLIVVAVDIADVAFVHVPTRSI